MAGPLHAAVDLGAGSGRVLVGGFSDGVTVEEAHRFTYEPRQSAGHLRWDFSRLLDGVRTGLRLAAAIAGRERRRLRSIGVDSWGVDYGLVDASGRLIEDPICYRDSRTAGVLERVFARIDRETLFGETGIQFLPLNTIFQLTAHHAEGLPPAAARLLMIPDLCHNALCGSLTGETTNASTTGLLNIRTGDWDDRIFDRLDLPRRLMPPLRAAGTELGQLRGDLREELDLPDAIVVQPATHDTASAVAGIPLRPGWAFISSGTWSLVGVERSTPLVNRSVLAANFTNERGVCGTFRFLKNVAGLWILESCRREWRAAGLEADVSRLVDGAADMPEPAGVVYPDASRFFNPASMVDELRGMLAGTGQASPADPVALTKVCLDSLALRYATIIKTIEGLTGSSIEGIHVAGGGAQNAYLNQATANATDRPVLAGPVEATGLGNLLVQAVACGVTSLPEGRQRIGESIRLQRFDPADRAAWDALARQYDAIERMENDA
jgi:rhamnulokinase